MGFFRALADGKANGEVWEARKRDGFVWRRRVLSGRSLASGVMGWGDSLGCWQTGKRIEKFGKRGGIGDGFVVDR